MLGEECPGDAQCQRKITAQLGDVFRHLADAFAQFMQKVNRLILRQDIQPERIHVRQCEVPARRDDQCARFGRDQGPNLRRVSGVIHEYQNFFVRQKALI